MDSVLGLQLYQSTVSLFVFLLGLLKGAQNRMRASTAPQAGDMENKASTERMEGGSGWLLGLARILDGRWHSRVTRCTWKQFNNQPLHPHFCLTPPVSLKFSIKNFTPSSRNLNTMA
jgi:hypothetical protein